MEEAIIHLPLFQQDRSLSFVSLGYSPPIQQTRYASILLFHLTQYRIEIMAAAELYSITLFLALIITPHYHMLLQSPYTKTPQTNI